MNFLTENAAIVAIIVSFVGLAFAWKQRTWVLAQDEGNETMS
jgi:Na+/H+-translocating membrane pyrophosphatase